MTLMSDYLHYVCSFTIVKRTSIFISQHISFLLYCLFGRNILSNNITKPTINFYFNNVFLSSRFNVNSNFPKYLFSFRYSLMYSCWEEVASERPSFLKIIEELESILTDLVSFYVCFKV